MLCIDCHGFGSRFKPKDGKRRWLFCGMCGGEGIVFSPRVSTTKRIIMREASTAVNNGIVISRVELPDNATMADVMVKIGVFPSLSQARKNGWNNPITFGKHVLTKRKIEVFIDE